MENKELIKYIDAVKLITELYVETRKNIPQTKYILFVSDEEVYIPETNSFVKPPKEIQGYWMQDSADDNTYISYLERIMKTGQFDYTCEFVKAKQVEEVIISYEKL